MRRIVTIRKCSLLVILASLMIALTACGIKAPSNKELAAMIPDDVLSYKLDGEPHTSRIPAIHNYALTLTMNDQG